MPNSDLPEDSVLRRTAESAATSDQRTAFDQPPTDSVLRRHYDQIHGAAASATSSSASPMLHATASGSENTFQDDEMTTSNAPIFKRLLWLALFALAGVIALYHWYSEKLKGNVAAREMEISESVQQLSDANSKLGLFAESEKTLRAEMEAATAQHQQQADKLTEETEAAQQAIQGLQNDMETLRKEHANSLAAEQRKAADAYAQLQGQYDLANQQIASLNGNVEQLKQDMAGAAQQHEAQLAETAAQHQMQIQEVNQRMAERVDYFRTALEGSEPDRAQQLVALDQQIMTVNQELDQSRQAIASLEATKAELDQQLADAKSEIQQKQETLQLAGQEMVAVQERLTQRQNMLVDMQTQYDAANAKAAQELAAAQEELRLANEAHAKATAEAQTLLENTNAAAAQAAADAATLLSKTQSEATAAMQQTTEKHTAQITEAEGKISTLSQELQNEQATLAALQQKHDTVTADLNAKLADTEQRLSDTDTKLSSTIAAAAASKKSLESDIADKKAQIAQLEQNIADQRQAAEQQLATAREEHREALSYTNALHTDLSALGGTQTEQGMLLRLANTELRFRIGGFKLPTGELPNLDKIAEFLNKYPNLSARVEGHTDSTGRDETNMELSYQRANAVMEALVERGVSAERMTAEGIGKNRPIATNVTPAGKRRNRRVEIYVSEN